MNETGLPPQRAEGQARTTTPTSKATTEVVALCERLLERQLADVARIAGEIDDPDATLAAIVVSHVTFTLEKGDYLAAWRQEFRDLPAGDAWRLRRLQRLYVEEWAQVVGGVRTDLSEGEARAAVHAALAVLHSATEYQSGLPADALAQLLVSMALAAVHGVAPEPTGGTAEANEDVIPC